MDSFKQRLTALFEKNPELQALRKLLRHNRLNAWLVGGSVRDLLLSRAVVDIDIAVDRDPTAIAQEWARKNNGRWFWLDQDRLQSRVLLANQLIVDFAPLRDATIAGDQSLRDFTINSLALSLDDEFSSHALMDPLNGLIDLEQRSLVFCSTRSIADDPLRMLKGIRHVVTLQMDLSNQALQQIKTESTAIKGIAGERIRDELGKILLTETPVLGFELMYDTGILQELFGPPTANWTPAQSFTDLQQLAQHMKAWSVDEEDGPVDNEPYSSCSLFMLATFFRDYQPNNLPDILHIRLRLSRHQQRIILSLQQEPDRQWLDRALKVASPRQKALLVEALGYFPVEQMIYWSIYRQMIPKDKVYELLEAYQNQQRLGRVPDLLDGNQLGGLLKKAGKEIGFWQQRIKLAELTGEIGDTARAISWLKSKISN